METNVFTKTVEIMGDMFFVGGLICNVQYIS